MLVIYFGTRKQADEYALANGHARRDVLTPGDSAVRVLQGLGYEPVVIYAGNLPRQEDGPTLEAIMRLRALYGPRESENHDAHPSAASQERFKNREALLEAAGAEPNGVRLDHVTQGRSIIPCAAPGCREKTSTLHRWGAGLIRTPSGQEVALYWCPTHMQAPESIPRQVSRLEHMTTCPHEPEVQTYPAPGRQLRVVQHCVCGWRSESVVSEGVTNISSALGNEERER